jgi:outer membrane biosynthesis protein TonB
MGEAMVVGRIGCATARWWLGLGLVACQPALVSSPESSQESRPTPAPEDPWASREVDDASKTPPTSVEDEPAPREAPTDPFVIRSKDPPLPEDGAIPTVRVATPTVGPAYSNEVVRRVIRRERPRLRACYDELLARSPQLRGRGDLHFTIGPSGEVVAASFVTSALEDTVFEACVVEAIRGARFPVPPGGGQLEVAYPMVFIPEGRPSSDDQAPPG